MNTGGTPHTDDEIKRVKNILRELGYNFIFIILYLWEILLRK